MMHKKKVLLLGGTGALGVYMAPELLNLGYQVYITSRSKHISNERDIIYITGNAKDPLFLQQLLQQDFDAIVDFMIYSTAEFKARVEELLSHTAHYIFLSSYRVYGDNGGKPISETSPRLLDVVDDAEYLMTDEYGLTKARQEDILKKSGRKNWTILRPAITYSKERFQLGTMEANIFVRRALAGKSVIFPRQMLDKKATLSWAGDVGRMMARMVFNKSTMGEVYTVSTAENHTWREIMDYYIELLGMRVKLVDLEVYQDTVGGIYQIKYDRMLDRVIDNTKALKVTGMNQEDFMPLKEGLKMELMNFVRQPRYTPYNDNCERKMNAITSTTTSKWKCKKVLSFWVNALRKVKKLHKEKRLLRTIFVKFLSLVKQKN